MLTAKDLKDRCWVDSTTGCWHWRGARNDAGRYPAVWSTELQRVTSLGAFIGLLKGKRSDYNNQWFAVCGLTTCANPDHREFGSRAEMMKRLCPKKSPVTRARMTAGKRKAGPVTPEMVETIRNSDETGKTLSAMLGLSQTTVSRIRLRRTWRDASTPSSSVFAWTPA